MERITEASLRLRAAMAGVFYLLTVVAEVAAFFVRGRLVVSSNVAATTANFLTNEPCFQWALAAGLLLTVCYLALTALFDDLFVTS